eukprot:228519-Amphidinium_carterae.2
MSEQSNGRCPIFYVHCRCGLIQIHPWRIQDKRVLLALNCKAVPYHLLGQFAKERRSLAWTSNLSDVSLSAMQLYSAEVVAIGYELPYHDMSAQDKVLGHTHGKWASTGGT